MKKLIIIALMLAPVSLMAQKYAHYNLADIMPNMPEYAQASADIQALAQQYQDEMDRLQKEYQTKAEEYQKLMEDQSTAQAILQSKYTDIQKMEESIQNFYQASQQDLQQQQEEKMEAIIMKIQNAVAKIADQGGYVYVTNVTSVSVTGPISYVNTALSTDITPELKKALGL